MTPPRPHPFPNKGHTPCCDPNIKFVPYASNATPNAASRSKSIKGGWPRSMAIHTIPGTSALKSLFHAPDRGRRHGCRAVPQGICGHPDPLRPLPHRQSPQARRQARRKQMDQHPLRPGHQGGRLRRKPFWRRARGGHCRSGRLAGSCGPQGLGRGCQECGCQKDDPGRIPGQACRQPQVSYRSPTPGPRPQKQSDLLLLGTPKGWTRRVHQPLFPRWSRHHQYPRAHHRLPGVALLHLQGHERPVCRREIHRWQQVLLAGRHGQRRVPPLRGRKPL
ncbi:MAG: hypothetical protein PWQ64_987 [Desulfomicrobiaceae bacterium]|nr:hypothetical protein [Desulfomicrobiaceae bacterium]MDK2873223.1 hypothetical protein [Desulfomicrobiaceae bacterium]